VVYSVPLHDYRNSPPPGEAAPAHCTALGKLLLAYQAKALAALGSGELARPTRKTIATVTELILQLSEIRRKGIAYSYEERNRGEVEVAAPVFTVSGRILTGISVTGTVAGLDLKSAAMQASRVAQAASAYCRRLNIPASYSSPRFFALLSRGFRRAWPEADRRCRTVPDSVSSVTADGRRLRRHPLPGDSDGLSARSGPSRPRRRSSTGRCRSL